MQWVSHHCTIIFFHFLLYLFDVLPYCIDMKTMTAETTETGSVVIYLVPASVEVLSAKAYRVIARRMNQVLNRSV